MSIQKTKLAPLNASDPMPGRQRTSRTLLIGGAIVLLITTLVSISIIAGRSVGAAPDEANVFVLALPAFLAGMLSFLSPCCLPILSAYFAYTFQVRRERMVRTTIAFFLGLATTLVALGATATALSQLLFRNLPTLTLVGGLMAYEMLQTMWGYQQPRKPAAPLTREIAKALDMELKDQ